MKLLKQAISSTENEFNIFQKKHLKVKKHEQMEEPPAQREFKRKQSQKKSEQFFQKNIDWLKKKEKTREVQKQRNEQ